MHGNAYFTVRALVMSGDIYWYQPEPEGNLTLMVSKNHIETLQGLGIKTVDTETAPDAIISKESLREKMGGFTDEQTALKDAQIKKEMGRKDRIRSRGDCPMGSSRA